MYRLNSAKHLISGGGAYRHNATHSYWRRVSQAEDGFVYVGKGYKICSKDEIEGPISNSLNTKWSGFQQKIKKRTYKRKVLPPELLSRFVVKLTCESAADGGVCDVYVVGTNHKTWRETQRVIKFLKPQVVFLELCSNRVCILTQQNDKVPSIGEMLDMWKKKEDPLLILLKWFLAKMMSCGEIWEGGEFRVAYQEAMQYGGKVILGDRL